MKNTKKITENTNTESWDDWGGEVTNWEDPIYADDADWGSNGSQTIDSKNTSVTQLPRSVKLMHTHNDWVNGNTNFDMGGGKTDNIQSYLDGKTKGLKGFKGVENNINLGVTNLVFDPFNRDDDYNKETIRRVEEIGGADTVTCNNVLNVIDSKQEILNVIQRCAEVLKPQGVAYFVVYERDGSGIGVQTKSGFQQSKKTQKYLPLIHRFFDKVKFTSGMIIAKDPIKQETLANWFTNADDSINGTNPITLNLRKGKEMNTPYKLSEKKLYKIVDGVVRKKLLENVFNHTKQGLEEDRIMFNEGTLLTEGRDDEILKGYIEQGVDEYYKPYLDSPLTEVPNTNALRGIAPTAYDSCLEHGMSLKHFFRHYLLSYFDINTMRKDKGPLEYIRGIARIACLDLGLLNSNANQSELATFKQIVMFMHRNKQLLGNLSYNKDLNGLSYDDLCEQVNGIRREFVKQSRANRVSFANNANYTVVPINSFEEASKYGRYTEWCVTHGKGHFNTYTPCGERFYFCLRDGFEGVEKVATNGCPLDDYGLSMVSVLIDMDGELVHVTTRWNHDYDGEDNEDLKTVEQFEKVMGISWNTFQPYSREELKQMGITPLDEVPELLEQGVDPREIFNHVGYFYGDFAKVKLNRKYNFLTTDGRLLSKRWFNSVHDFNEGFAVGKLNGKWNFLGTDGKFLWDKPWDEWFDGAGEFREGFAPVGIKGKWNFLSRDGKTFLWDKPWEEWFDEALVFCQGFVAVGIKGKWNFLGTDRKLLWDKPWEDWFDTFGFFSGGFAKVKLKGNDFKLSTDGVLYDMDGNPIQESKKTPNKKVMINESQIKILTEGVNNGIKLPKFIFNRVKKHNTSLGENEVFPPEMDYAFDYVILKRRIEEVTENVHEMFGDNISLDELTNLLNSLLKECKEIERRYTPNLEKICENVVYSLFEVPQETINFKCSLVEKADGKGVKVMPEDEDNRNFDFEDLNEYGKISKEILKRRMVNALIQGASYEYTFMYRKFADEISRLNENLVDLYDRIITLNDYLLFYKQENITDKHQMQGGFVKVTLGSQNKKTEITSEGILLPFLINESIRGFLELFASHGLPKDIAKANYILSKADFLIAEPWDLRMGVGLWRYFSEHIDDTTLVPYAFSALVSLETDDFNHVLREIFAKTKLGKEYLKDLHERAVHNIEMQDFIGTVNQKNSAVSVISDNFISSDELDDCVIEEEN